MAICFEYFKRIASFSVVNIILLTALISAIAFLFFGTAIATLLFSGSTRADSAQIGLVLAGFSLGLVPYSAQLLLLRGFYAFEDTRTPVLINLISTAFSILLLPLLVNLSISSFPCASIVSLTLRAVDSASFFICSITIFA